MFPADFHGRLQLLNHLMRTAEPWWHRAQQALPCTGVEAGEQSIALFTVPLGAMPQLNRPQIADTEVLCKRGALKRLADPAFHHPVASPAKQIRQYAFAQQGVE